MSKFRSSQSGFLIITMRSLYSNSIHGEHISIRFKTFGLEVTVAVRCHINKSGHASCGQPTNQQLMPYQNGTKSEECFHHRVESMTSKKISITLQHGVPNKVAVFLLVTYNACMQLAERLNPRYYSKQGFL